MRTAGRITGDIARFGKHRQYLFKKAEVCTLLYNPYKNLKRRHTLAGHILICNESIKDMKTVVACSGYGCFSLIVGVFFLFKSKLWQIKYNLIL